MKLFIRDHIPLLIFTMLEMLAVVAVFWFDGYDHPLTALYGIFLGLFIFAGYLIFRFFSQRLLYMRLSRPFEALNESIAAGGTAPVSQAFNHLLETQYRHYQNLLQIWERKQQEHLTFMNQWVHQMKTPVSVIEMITQGEDDERLLSISEETDRIRRGLEMVLYVSRLETFEQDFSVEPVGLRQAVNETVHELKRYFIRSHVYPEVQVDDGVMVQTDAKWMRFMLEQLLSNAIKYAAGTGSKITVSARTEDDRSLTLEIRDRGVGIPRADLRRVFRPFYTGENGRRFKESTGMGLYLVKEVADKLGHGIRIESVPGEGTAVRLHFERSQVQVRNR
ncbi:sensor histidine kinase [Paenibacillus favisporus]|uniref:sensor histidine kinase n=1 Tax=Paenibacillus favisporus TaxID=221028 RepID=UPI002DBBFE49|nr:sensor histidine kinase [Paenibacillus favisporus]MEC0175465.1 sensor histidine kinase [Paenibacillus favisporus]